MPTDAPDADADAAPTDAPTVATDAPVPIASAGAFAAAAAVGAERMAPRATRGACRSIARKERESISRGQCDYITSFEALRSLGELACCKTLASPIEFAAKSAQTQAVDLHSSRKLRCDSA